MTKDRKKPRGKKEEIFYLSILFLFLFFLFFKAVILKEVVGWGGGDNSLHVLAYRLEVANFLKKFKTLPFWSPALSGGFPLASDPAVGAFYPFSWFFFCLFSPSAALNYFIFFHFLLAGFGLYFYLKHLKLFSFAALLGAASFAGSLYLVSTADNIAILAASSWTPLVFLSLEKASNKMNTFRLSLASLAIAAQILAGYPQVAVLTLLGVFLLYLYRFRSEKKKKIFLLFFLCLIGGLLLSLPQIVSVLKLLPFTPRSQGFLKEALANSVSPLSLLSLLFPGLFKGLPVTIGKDVFYFGFPTLFFFLFSLYALLKSTPQVRFFAFLFFFSVFCSLGRYGGFYYLIGSIPGFNLFRAPEQFLLLAVFSSSILAADGLNWFFSSKKESLAPAVRKIFFFILASFAFVFIASLFLKIFEPSLKARLLSLVQEKIYGKPPHPFPLSYYYAKFEFIYRSFADRLSPLSPVTLTPLFSFSLLAIILLLYLKEKMDARTGQKSVILLLFLEMLSVIALHQFIPGIKREVFEQTPEVARFLKKDSTLFRIYSWPARLKFGLLHEEEQKTRLPEKTYLFVSQNLLANFPPRYGLTTIQGVEALWFKRQENLLNLLESKDELRSEKEKLSKLSKLAKVLGMLNVKYIISPYPIYSPNLKKLFHKGETYLYLNSFFLPRAYLVNQYKIFPEEKILNYLTSKKFEPSKEVILEKKPNFLLRFSNKNPGKARVEKYQPGYIRIRANATADCFLVLSDSFYPGWEARLDGKKVPIYQANYLFRAVPIKKGQHRIEFFYYPEEVYLTSYFSLATLSAIAGLLLITCFKKILLKT